MILGRKADGRLPATADGKIDLYAVIRAGIAALAQEQGTDGGSAPLETARIRLVTAQAEARELLNAQLRGDAVLSEDLEAVVGGTFDAVRTKMLAIPVTAAAQVIGLTSKVDIQEQISSLVSDALADLASTEVISTVKDRARRRAGRSAVGDGGEDAD